MEIAIVILLALAALAALVLPFFRPERPQAVASAPLDLDAEVKRYREALRAGTACRACAEANPPGSRFCSRCGRALGDEPVAD